MDTGCSSGSEALPRILPFAAFMGFVALESGTAWLITHHSASPQWQHLVYVVKVIVAGAVLWRYRACYRELSWCDLRLTGRTAASIMLGLAVFAAWIGMTWPFATLGTPQGFNPYLVSDPLARWLTIAFRLAGAVIVVPVMEELFWRSFLTRYVISIDFSKVSIGAFTWPSFVVSVVLFGLEHDYYLAGMLAGALYNLLLYRTKSLAQCIVAHGATNLALGIYVLQTGKWNFW